MELVVKGLELVDPETGDTGSLGNRQRRVGDHGVEVGDVAFEQGGICGVAVARENIERVEFLQPSKRRTRLDDPYRRIDVWVWVLGGVACEHDTKLGDPDREMILAVARRVKEDEREIAATNREAGVADSEIGWDEDEIVEASRLQLALLRAREVTVIAREALGAQLMADDRCRVGRVGTAEDLVPPCVVIVSVRVDDE
jgi:hypothetical protein